MIDNVVRTHCEKLLYPLRQAVASTLSDHSFCPFNYGISQPYWSTSGVHQSPEGCPSWLCCQCILPLRSLAKGVCNPAGWGANKRVVWLDGRPVGELLIWSYTLNYHLYHFLLGQVELCDEYTARAPECLQHPGWVVCTVNCGCGEMSPTSKRVRWGYFKAARGGEEGEAGAGAIGSRAGGKGEGKVGAIETQQALPQYAQPPSHSQNQACLAENFIILCLAAKWCT